LEWNGVEFNQRNRGSDEAAYFMRFSMEAMLPHSWMMATFLSAYRARRRPESKAAKIFAME
jgi:hypothetical protein